MRRDTTTSTCIQVEDERRRKHERWFTGLYDELCDYVFEEIPVLDADTALYRLKVTLPKCRAKIKSQFRKWAVEQITKQADEARFFKYAQNLSRPEMLILAKARPVRKGTKPFEYEIHGEKAFIRLEDARGNVLPWIIPAHWLPVAKALWPCHVKRNKAGLYVSKKVAKQRLNGRWGQADLPVHRLFLDCDDAVPVRARDGNPLNWADDNLQVHKTDSFDSRTVSLESFSNVFSLGWKPAISTKVRLKQDRVSTRSYTNEHERRVWEWLRGFTPHA